jgi:hypothetical protein
MKRKKEGSADIFYMFLAKSEGYLIALNLLD